MVVVVVVVFFWYFLLELMQGDRGEKGSCRRVLGGV
jgi:hypothetical protein